MTKMMTESDLTPEQLELRDFMLRAQKTADSFRKRIAKMAGIDPNNVAVQFAVIRDENGTAGISMDFMGEHASELLTTMYHTFSLAAEKLHDEDECGECDTEKKDEVH